MCRSIAISPDVRAFIRAYRERGHVPLVVERTHRAVEEDGDPRLGAVLDGAPRTGEDDRVLPARTWAAEGMVDCERLGGGDGGWAEAAR